MDLVQLVLFFLPAVRRINLMHEHHCEVPLYDIDLLGIQPGVVSRSAIRINVAAMDLKIPLQPIGKVSACHRFPLLVVDFTKEYRCGFPSLQYAPFCVLPSG